MPVAHEAVNVAQAAIKIVTGASKTRSRTNGKRTVTVTNEGANVIFVGGAGVTTSAYGAKVAAGAVFGPVSLGDRDDLWAISTTGTNAVKTLTVS